MASEQNEGTSGPQAYRIQGPRESCAGGASPNEGLALPLTPPDLEPWPPAFPLPSFPRSLVGSEQPAPSPSVDLPSRRVAGTKEGSYRGVNMKPSQEEGQVAQKRLQSSQVEAAEQPVGQVPALGHD